MGAWPGDWKGLREGMHVEVIRGPLQGVRGILLRKDKRHRLVLGVRLIQQAAANTARDLREKRDWLSWLVWSI